MQMIQLIRQYKGITPVNTHLNTAAEVKPVTMDVAADFAQWEQVEWHYRDYVNDTEPRDAIGYGGIHYTDNTGRNDIAIIKMVNDSEKLYAYIQTEKNITGMGEGHCLSLFIRTGKGEASWHGYDFVVGRAPASETGLVVETYTADGWKTVAQVPYLLKGNKLQLAIPLEVLGLEGEEVTVEFKVADNYQEEAGVWSFYLHGDAAPYGRLNFVYDSRGTSNIPSHIINDKRAIPNGR